MSDPYTDPLAEWLGNLADMHQPMVQLVDNAARAELGLREFFFFSEFSRRSMSLVSSSVRRTTRYPTYDAAQRTRATHPR